MRTRDGASTFLESKSGDEGFCGGVLGDVFIANIFACPGGSTGSFYGHASMNGVGVYELGALNEEAGWCPCGGYQDGNTQCARTGIGLYSRAMWTGAIEVTRWESGYSRRDHHRDCWLRAR
jgi:hypothetical protein